jgi:hypothetical protein
MSTDPNDKRRTLGAAARRDMDGRANQPPTGKTGRTSGCAVVLVAAFGLTGLGELIAAVA